LSFPTLATLIEYDRLEEAEEAVRQRWSEFADKGIDKIVLGCTHYTLIKDRIQKIVGDGVEVIDSNEAVAKQAKRIYEGRVT